MPAGLPAVQRDMITKAIIRSNDSGTHTVTVQPVGSLGTFWKSVKVAKSIPGADCAIGYYCAIASFNEQDPADAVVVASWP